MAHLADLEPDHHDDPAKAQRQQLERPALQPRPPSFHHPSRGRSAMARIGVLLGMRHRRGRHGGRWSRSRASEGAKERSRCREGQRKVSKDEDSTVLSSGTGISSMLATLDMPITGQPQIALICLLARSTLQCRGAGLGSAARQQQDPLTELVDSAAAESGTVPNCPGKRCTPVCHPPCYAAL